MSGDLISRDKLLEDFRSTITEKSDTFDWLNMIARQPVAYDVDEVVEQIREYADNVAELGGNFLPKVVIEIVKGGGLNE